MSVCVTVLCVLQCLGLRWDVGEMAMLESELEARRSTRVRAHMQNLLFPKLHLLNKKSALKFLKKNFLKSTASGFNLMHFYRVFHFEQLWWLCLTASSKKLSHTTIGTYFDVFFPLNLLINLVSLSEFFRFERKIIRKILRKN